MFLSKCVDHKIFFFLATTLLDIKSLKRIARVLIASIKIVGVKKSTKISSNACKQYQRHRPAGLLLWFVLVCRVMPRSLMFQDKLQLYKAKSSIFNSCFFILLYQLREKHFRETDSLEMSIS